MDSRSCTAPASGTVRLSDYGLSMKGIPNESSLRVADVSGVGVLLCRLLGVTTDAEGTPEGGSPGARQSKRSLAVGASPLGMAARQMAKTARNRRAAGYEAVQARLT
ncbi:MAG: hypothetical protein M3Z13_03435, partial [Candidatus Dormibacteraeota bacterium]|nr:hypothetical protein [Candidatus Dormibacteraeota bacterium]